MSFCIRRLLQIISEYLAKRSKTRVVKNTFISSTFFRIDIMILLMADKLMKSRLIRKKQLISNNLYPVILSCKQIYFNLFRTYKCTDLYDGHLTVFPFNFNHCRKRILFGNKSLLFVINFRKLIILFVSSFHPSFPFQKWHEIIVA